MSSSDGLALLAVDVQPTFFQAMTAPEAFLGRCRLAVSAARLLSLPVLFTEQVPAKLGPTHPDLLLDAGASVERFPKSSFSAFGAEGLADRLAGASVEHLLVLGLEGPVCVHQTALEALRLGLGVTVLADAVTSRRAADQDVCFAALRAAGVAVLPVETVFYSALRGADHPAFREFTDLVKRFGQVRSTGS